MPNDGFCLLSCSLTSSLVPCEQRLPLGDSAQEGGALLPTYWVLSLVPSTSNAKQHISKIHMICCWRERERWWFLISEARFEEVNFTLMKAVKREEITF